MCGVSTQTVSRVINKRPDVSPETRQAVEAAIAATGFQPSAVARSLVQRRSQTLGVIVAGLRYFGVAQTLNGITEESQASGYGILLKEIESTDTVDIAPVIEFMIAHRVEGIIFAAPAARHEHRDGPGPAAGVVPADRVPEVGAVAGLLDDRHRQLRRRPAGDGPSARARSPADRAPRRPVAWREAQDRHDGWRDALRDAGLEPGPVVPGTWSSASGEVAFEQLLALAPDLDGIFVANDQMALGVLHVAHARGIAIPDDIAVVGFDGLDEAAQFTPTLTTVVQPLRELGELAVREVLGDRERGARPGDGPEPDPGDPADRPRERPAPSRTGSRRRRCVPAVRHRRSRRPSPAESAIADVDRVVHERALLLRLDAQHDVETLDVGGDGDLGGPVRHVARRRHRRGREVGALVVAVEDPVRADDRRVPDVDDRRILARVRGLPRELEVPRSVRAASVRVRTTSLSAGISASAGSIRPSMGSAIGNVRSATSSSRLTSSVPSVPVVFAS